jgi:MFS family permease
MTHIVLGALALGLTMVLLAAAPDLAFALPAVFLVGMASVLYMTATTAMVQIEAKPEMTARVLSLQTVLMMGTTPIGGPLLGWLADVTGGRTPLILGGAVALAAGVFGFLAARRYPG